MRQLYLQVALCTIFFICSSLSQSINVNSKHAVHNNKQLQTSSSISDFLRPDTNHNSGDDEDYDEEDDDDDDDLKNSDYSHSEYDFGSSGSESILPSNIDDFGLFDKKDKTPIFKQVPMNTYVMKNRHATVKCQAVDALDVSMKFE
jgi:hypothetical protein